MASSTASGGVPPSVSSGAYDGDVTELERDLRVTKLDLAIAEQEKGELSMQLAKYRRFTMSALSQLSLLQQAMDSKLLRKGVARSMAISSRDKAKRAAADQLLARNKAILLALTHALADEPSPVDLDRYELPSESLSMLTGSRMRRDPSGSLSLGSLGSGGGGGGGEDSGEEDESEEELVLSDTMHAHGAAHGSLGRRSTGVSGAGVDVPPARKGASTLRRMLRQGVGATGQVGVSAPARAAAPLRKSHLLAHVFSFLAPPDLARASCVCTTWRALPLRNDTVLWRQMASSAALPNTMRGALWTAIATTTSTATSHVGCVWTADVLTRLLAWFEFPVIDQPDAHTWSGMSSSAAMPLPRSADAADAARGGAHASAPGGRASAAGMGVRSSHRVSLVYRDAEDESEEGGDTSASSDADTASDASSTASDDAPHAYLRARSANAPRSSAASGGAGHGQRRASITTAARLAGAPGASSLLSPPASLRVATGSHGVGVRCIQAWTPQRTLRARTLLKLYALAGGTAASEPLPGTRIPIDHRLRFDRLPQPAPLDLAQDSPTRALAAPSAPANAARSRSESAPATAHTIPAPGQRASAAGRGSHTSARASATFSVPASSAATGVARAVVNDGGAAHMPLDSALQSSIFDAFVHAGQATERGSDAVAQMRNTAATVRNGRAALKTCFDAIQAAVQADEPTSEEMSARLAVELEKLVAAEATLVAGVQIAVESIAAAHVASAHAEATLVRAMLHARQQHVLHLAAAWLYKSCWGGGRCDTAAAEEPTVGVDHVLTFPPTGSIVPSADVWLPATVSTEPERAALLRRVRETRDHGYESMSKWTAAPPPPVAVLSRPYTAVSPLMPLPARLQHALVRYACEDFDEEEERFLGLTNVPLPAVEAPAPLPPTKLDLGPPTCMNTGSPLQEMRSRCMPTPQVAGIVTCESWQTALVAACNEVRDKAGSTAAATQRFDECPAGQLDLLSMTLGVLPALPFASCHAIIDADVRRTFGEADALLRSQGAHGQDASQPETSPGAHSSRPPPGGRQRADAYFAGSVRSAGGTSSAAMGHRHSVSSFAHRAPAPSGTPASTTSGASISIRLQDITSEAGVAAVRESVVASSKAAAAAAAAGVTAGIDLMPEQESGALPLELHNVFHTSHFSPSPAGAPPLQLCTETVATLRSRLRQVLLAYSAWDCGVGYCQGMNFLASLLILHMQPASAFWGLTALLHGPAYSLNDIFAHGLTRVGLFFKVIASLMDAHLPDVSRHLHTAHVVPDMFAAGWLMTLFSSLETLPLPYVAPLWDAFLLRSWKAIFRVVLVLLRSVGHDLLQGDFAVIVQYLHKYPLHRLPPTAGALMRQCAHFKVTNRQISLLEERLAAETAAAAAAAAAASAAGAVPAPSSTRSSRPGVLPPLLPARGSLASPGVRTPGPSGGSVRAFLSSAALTRATSSGSLSDGGSSVLPAPVAATAGTPSSTAAVAPPAPAPVPAPAPAQPPAASMHSPTISSASVMSSVSAAIRRRLASDGSTDSGLSPMEDLGVSLNLSTGSSPSSSASAALFSREKAETMPAPPPPRAAINSQSREGARPTAADVAAALRGEAPVRSYSGYSADVDEAGEGGGVEEEEEERGSGSGDARGAGSRAGSIGYSGADSVFGASVLARGASIGSTTSSLGTDAVSEARLFSPSVFAARAAVAHDNAEAEGGWDHPVSELRFTTASVAQPIVDAADVTSAAAAPPPPLPSDAPVFLMDMTHASRAAAMRQMQPPMSASLSPSGSTPRVPAAPPMLAQPTYDDGLGFGDMSASLEADDFGLGFGSGSAPQGMVHASTMSSGDADWHSGAAMASFDDFLNPSHAAAGPLMLHAPAPASPPSSITSAGAKMMSPSGAEAKRSMATNAHIVGRLTSSSAGAPLSAEAVEASVFHDDPLFASAVSGGGGVAGGVAGGSDASSARTGAGSAHGSTAPPKRSLFNFGSR